MNDDHRELSIFPIKGKIANAFMTSTKKFFENDEISSLFTIFGYKGYQSKFDPDKFKPEKVVIATDSDPDGKHIRSLVLMMFLRYLPEILIRGKLYAVTPPLYGLQLGKNKMKFFADDTEYVEYVESVFCKEFTILNKKNKPMSKSEVVKLLYNNSKYVKILDSICSLFSVDPYLLEYLLYNKDLPYNKFKNAVEKQYKYLTVNKENNTILIRGLVGSLYQTVFFNDRMLNECRPIIDLIERSDKFYVMNDKPATLYTIMRAYTDLEPNVDRYKGLGEKYTPLTIAIW